MIATRRNLKTGENFDLLCGYNLNRRKDQMAVWHWLDKKNPVVIMMAPACTPLVPFANINYYKAYGEWLDGYKLAAPRGRLCGQVARCQCKKKKDKLTMTGLALPMSIQTQVTYMMKPHGQQHVLERMSCGKASISA